MLHSLIYVSRSKIVPDENDSTMDSIVAASRRHNPPLDVTGALVFTGTHFAQVIEGSPEAIDRLMNKISADHRHDRVDIVRRGEIDARSFSDWAMAYSGPSSYVADHLRPLLRTGEGGTYEPDAADRLIAVMQEFGS